MSEPGKAVRSGADTVDVAVDEVTLTIDWNQPDEVPPVPARVRLPEPMLRYRCNQQGCCCTGWRIGFQASDLVRLRRRLEPPERDELTHDLEFRVREDNEGDTVVSEFFIVDGEGRCRYVTPDKKGCGLHAKYGLHVLPNLCVDFPVATFTEGTDHASLYFDPVCPSVLDQLAESEAPYTIADVATEGMDDAFKLRASHTRGIPIVRTHGAEVALADADRVRRVIIQDLADATKPVWEHLQAIETAAFRLGNGTMTPDEFAPVYGLDPGPFLRHLGHCLGAHGRIALEQNFFSYRRFIFDITVDPADDRWLSLGDHLVDWGPAYERWLAPNEDALRPLQLRFLAHRSFTPYAAPRGDLRSAIGRNTHVFATALRYASALGAVLERPVDVPVMKVAIGAAEYFYRSKQIPVENMPWFEE